MGAPLKRRGARRAAATASPGPAVAPGPAAGAAASLVGAAGAAAIAVWTFRGAAGYGFSADDFLGLARAHGLADRLPFGWRWLSHQLWWDVVAGPLGDSARAAHVSSIALHAAVAALLAWLLARRLPAFAAFAGAAFVASHPNAYVAVYWAAASGDLLGVLLALAALGFGLGRRARGFAPLLFALALLAKESVLPMPLAWLAIALAWPGAAGRTPPWRDPAWLACAAVALVFGVALRAAAHGPGVGGEPYALSLAAVPANLLTYAGWIANRWAWTTRSISEAVEPYVYPWGAGLLAAWVAASLVPAARRAGALAAGLAGLAMLAPVLPLANHTYHYYTYAALPAAGALLAAILAATLGRLPRAPAVAAAAALGLLFAYDGGVLVSQIEHLPWKYEGSRADAITDRALISERAIADLRAAHLPAGSAVRMWSPQLRAMAAEGGTPADRESYEEENVRVALAGGLGLRVAVPAVDSVAFVRAFDPRDSLAWWAVYRRDGRLRVLRAADLARVLAAGPPTSAGAPATR